MDTRSLHIIWCNVINKIYPTVILHWELEIRCSCTHFTCSWVWTNYIVKHQIRLILILRIHSAIYEGLATKSFRCSRMFWTASNNNIQFIFGFIFDEWSLIDLMDMHGHFKAIWISSRWRALIGRYAWKSPNFKEKYIWFFFFS